MRLRDRAAPGFPDHGAGDRVAQPFEQALEALSLVGEVHVAHRLDGTHRLVAVDGVKQTSSTDMVWRDMP